MGSRQFPKHAEEISLVFFRNAYSRVFNHYLNKIWHNFAIYVYVPIWSEFEGIWQKIDEDLGESLLVSHDDKSGELVLNVEREFNLLWVALESEEFVDTEHSLVKVAFFFVNLEYVVFKSSQIQNVIDQIEQKFWGSFLCLTPLLDLLDHHGYSWVIDIVLKLFEFCSYHFVRNNDRVQRSSELMWNIGHHCSLVPILQLLFFQLLHVCNVW